jgi:hypothetical protein
VGIPFGYVSIPFILFLINHRQHNTIPHHYHIAVIVGQELLLDDNRTTVQITDHKSGCFKCLMYRWRLMNASCYGFEIMNTNPYGKLYPSQPTTSKGALHKLPHASFLLFLILIRKSPFHREFPIRGKIKSRSQNGECSKCC